MTATVKRQSWKAFESHHQEVSKRHLRELFKEDPERCERMAVDAVGLYFDYSKNRITDETLELLFRLAEESGLPSRINLVRRYRERKEPSWKLPALTAAHSPSESFQRAHH